VSNLALRTMVAAVGIPLLLYLAATGSWPLALLVFAIQALILREWIALNGARATRLHIPGLVIGAIAVNFLIIGSGSPVSLGTFLCGMGLMLLLEMFRKQRQPLASLGASTLFLIYVSLPLALWVSMGNLSAATRFGSFGPLGYLFVTTWICDTGAYFVGRALGRHKLYPAASPNKTVEGFVAGAVTSAVVLPVAAALGVVSLSLPDYFALPLIVGLIGQCGDLLESLMKREVNVKDTSALLPGHGGLLDRFDSLLLATPFFFAYLLLTPGW
jgi:phosphatidate cytidylyltransferase